MPAKISVAQAAAQRDAGKFILEVRQPDEWAEYHVPGSTLIPLGELKSPCQRGAARQRSGRSGWFAHGDGA